MTTGPKYLDLLTRHVLDSEHVKKPGIHHVEVRHADGCAVWRGEACDCSPVVISGAPIDRKYGGER